MRNRKAYWGRLVADQEASGKSVREFCRVREVNEHSFYTWRRRLSEEREPVRFALVETGAVSESGKGSPIELVLTNGERLRIAAGVSAELLRTVLGVLRG
jgi:transposase-like protein